MQAEASLVLPKPLQAHHTGRGVTWLLRLRKGLAVRGPGSLTCYSPDGHGVLFRRGHRDHDVVHVSQVLPMRQIDGFPFPVHPIFGEPGLFEIYRVPGVQDQRVHDGAGHQLDHSRALLPGAGGLRVGLRGGWAVIILHRRD